MSKTKYLASFTFVIFSIIFFTIEVAHDFRTTKTLYASFYPEKYFEKDVIQYEWQTSGAGSGGRGFYYYYGTLRRNKKKARIFSDEGYMKKTWSPNLEIPVWYCNLNGSVGIRTGKEPPKPYSFELLNSQMTILVWLLFLPALVYIIKYRIYKWKSKSLKKYDK